MQNSSQPKFPPSSLWNFLDKTGDGASRSLLSVLAIVWLVVAQECPPLLLRTKGRGDYTLDFFRERRHEMIASKNSVLFFFLQTFVP